MRRRILILAAVLVGIVSFGTMATQVQHGWQDYGTYVISVTDIPPVPENEKFSVDQTQTYSSLPLVQTYSSEIVKWYSFNDRCFNDPIDTIMVGPSTGSSTFVERTPTARIMVLVAPVTKNNVLTMVTTLMNSSSLTATASLDGIICALTPERGWIPDSVPGIHWMPTIAWVFDPPAGGTIMIEPRDSAMPPPFLMLAIPPETRAAYDDIVRVLYPDYIGKSPYLAIGFPVVGGMAWGWLATTAP